MIGHPIYVAQVQDTITDYLTNSSVAVLARPTAEDPFKFHPEIWLRGDPGADLPPISHHVDSETRRQLAINDSDAVLFVLGSGDEPSWQRLAYVNAPVREVLGAVLSAKDEWRDGPSDPDRFKFFAGLYQHPDRTVRSLALLEILQAPYGLMRTLQPQMSRDEIERSLQDPMQVNYTPLYIAMLGLIDDPGAAPLVRSMVDRAARLGLGSDLAPWAMALIEIDGQEGLDRVARLVLDPRLTTPETAQAALTALALHGSEGRIELRGEIAEVLGDAANLSPTLAAYAISPLVQWQDWRAVAAVEAHLAGGDQIGLRERIALTGYLAAAGQAAQSETNAD